ncbi:MAG: type I-E CRISPR-associated protein Cse1/CasA [Anaerolineales bacterium]|nr:type I-E CRISPR-associated protein Cse1/CasA [Anaerolineales bacterium]
MTQAHLTPPSFNLWTEPWITVERPDGSLDELNIIQTLLEAPAIHALYEPSPLDMVAVHRLLVAILQAAYRPQRAADLAAIWRSGRFAEAALQALAETYAHRFDLFAEDMPFMQSADLPLHSRKGIKIKPVGNLFHEEPPGTTAYFYNHKLTKFQTCCSKCLAKGLLVIPTHSTSGGRGIRPSINGEPPIYILPAGENLFHSLAASLTTPRYQPGRPEHDLPWWERNNIVPQYLIAHRVGYLHSLTFPARRVRLYPIPMALPCSRCGSFTNWGVKDIVFDMGESRPKDAAFWRDPFVAYSKPKGKEKDKPTPIRPIAGRAIWREFVNLFLPTHPDEYGLQPLRPAVLNQLEDLQIQLPFNEDAPIPLRVIGLRSEKGQMKIYEWQESGFALPPHLLSDIDSAKTIEESIAFADKCNGIIKSTFQDYFGGDRLKTVKAQMSRRYWQQLGHTFHGHIQQYTAPADAAALLHIWVQTVIDQAQTLFEETVETLPDDGATLRRRVEAINHCRAKLWSHRNKTYPQEKPL